MKYALLARLLIYVFAVLFFSSCNSSNTEEQAQPEQEVSDSVQTSNSIASEDSIYIFENNLNPWIAGTLKKNYLNWGRFHLLEFWSEDSISAKPFTENDSFYHTYSPLLRWSSDSNYVLDLGTYGATILKDKSGASYAADGDIDTKVSLIYPKTKTRSDLLFFGSGTSVTDARWIDSTQVAVLGLHENSPNSKPDTLLWIIDAKQIFFRKYKLQ